MRLLPLVAAATAAFLVVACSSPTPPRGVTVVNNFDAKRYLGTWYEIARLDHRFERGLTRVQAQYALNADGSVQVINRGYDPVRQRWQQATGVAKFMGSSDTGLLKVSFFRPFYGTYAVFALDHEQYQYAVISGPSHDYLWILARTPTLTDSLKQQLVEKAQAAVVNAKRKYDGSVAALKDLLDKRDALRRDELITVILKSNKPYEEILQFIKDDSQ